MCFEILQPTVRSTKILLIWNSYLLCKLNNLLLNHFSCCVDSDIIHILKTHNHTFFHSWKCWRFDRQSRRWGVVCSILIFFSSIPDIANGWWICVALLLLLKEEQDQSSFLFSMISSLSFNERGVLILHFSFALISVNSSHKTELI